MIKVAHTEKLQVLVGLFILLLKCEHEQKIMTAN